MCYASLNDGMWPKRSALPPEENSYVSKKNVLAMSPVPLEIQIIILP